ncbi:hypothetical protein [Komagataeibacter europaeus]|uniref:hypothetical protein n=1 Tax=Komagataeibacter europaeus TaxID=33995 RepID=UPI0021750E60|nr:hypothetical protein [Komagataeibacter europaeus]
MQAAGYGADGKDRASADHNTLKQENYAVMTQRLADIRRFYGLMDILKQKMGGPRTLASSSGRLSWPQRGVYFFFENGETRSTSGSGPRVVRIGTHALKKGAGTTLWKRLSGHQGTIRSGSGNHRGSIFRLLVGTALMARDGNCCPTWDNGCASAPKETRDAEQDMEIRVSKVIGAMPFLWLPVEDEAGRDSKRGTIERGTIALLSNLDREPIDPPSPDWLGLYCSRPRIRQSGLWNATHTNEDYDPVFLDLFQHFIHEAEDRT